MLTSCVTGYIEHALHRLPRSGQKMDRPLSFTPTTSGKSKPIISSSVDVHTLESEGTSEPPDLQVFEQQLQEQLGRLDWLSARKTSEYLIGLSPYSAKSWFRFALVLMAECGLLVESTFNNGSIDICQKDRRHALNLAMRSLNLASTLSKRPDIADIFVAKAHVRFVLGQSLGALKDLQIALRYDPHQAIALQLQKDPRIARLVTVASL